MIEKIKLLIGRYILHKKLKKNEQIIFNKFFTNADDYFIILPEDDESFKHSFVIIKYLFEHKKNITLFVIDYRKSLILDSKKYHIVTFENENKNIFNLPKQEILEKIEQNQYDLLIDLNRNNNIFYSAITLSVKAKYRVGFTKEYADLYYNFLIANDERNSELSYKNLLNSLQMF
ncbi:MAG: hypothetical protein V1773_16410 [bacterium]